MLKSKWSQRFTGGHLFSGRKSAANRQYQAPSSHGLSSTKEDFLSNIVEEGSSEDIPKTFEQEEQYMNECLRSVGGSVEDVHGSEAEEYDFDDFNSIASTASILNLNSDLSDLDRLRMCSPPPVSQKSKPGPTWKGTRDQNKNGLSSLNLNDKLTNFQKSISRVQNWDRLGGGGEMQDWKQVLLRAAEAGDLITVQDAVSHLGTTKDSLITALDLAGNTPLHKAAENGKLQCLKWLVKRAPQEAVAIGNHDNMTPAAIATQFGQVECLEWLVEQTEASKELEKHTFTLVHYAAKEGQEKCLKYLLSYLGKTQDITDISDSNGISPAHLAAREGHLECLQTLVDFTSDITRRDKEGLSPTDYAFKAGQTGCGRYLVLVETCFGLSAKVKSLSRDLARARHENEELRNRVQFMENHSHVYMMDRPEAVGEDQSDSSSNMSLDSLIYSGSKVRPSLDTRRSSSAPDGESPKGTKLESSVYEFQLNGHLSPSSRHHRPSMYDIEAQSKPQLTDKMMRRRGSSPATLAESSSDDTQQSTSKRHSWTPREQKNVRESPWKTNKPPIYVTTSHETSRGNHANLLTSKDYSASSARSSRSQSPYRSHQSTASSVEAVLLTSSTECQPQTSRRNDNRNNYSGSIVMKDFVRERGFSFNGTENQASLSSESPFSSDSDVEHTYERRSPLKNTSQTASAKEELKKIRTERDLEARELRQKSHVQSSANQHARFCWHGIDKDGKIPTPQKPAHDSLGVASRSRERQAQVTWGDPRIQRRFTIGSSVVMGNNKTFEHVLARQTESSYKVTRVHDVQQTFLTQNGDYEEKPWYETEEVEL